MIRGNKISLRIIKEADLNELSTLINDIESKGDFLPTRINTEVLLKKEYSRNGLISESSEKYIIDTGDDSIVGLVWSFKSVPYFDAIEIGFQVFNLAHRNKGIATEAVTLLTNYIFESKQVNRVEIRMSTDNRPSIKVAQKCGFQLEGTNKEAAFSKGMLHDMHIYAKLRSDWLKERATNN